MVKTKKQHRCSCWAALIKAGILIINLAQLILSNT